MPTEALHDQAKAIGRSKQVVPLLLDHKTLAETPHCAPAPVNFHPSLTSYLLLTCLGVTFHDQFKLLLKRSISHPSPLHVLLLPSLLLAWALA